MYWTAHKGFTAAAKDMISITVSAGLAIYALWPMVALMMDWRMPSVYYMRLIAWFVLGVVVVVTSHVTANNAPPPVPLK